MGYILIGKSNLFILFMTLRTYLAGITICTILSLISWILVIENTDPNKTDLIGHGLFYLSLFFFLAGIFSLVGFFARRIINKNKAEFSQVGVAFRQGLFLSFVTIGMLFLQGNKMLSTTNAFLFVIGISLLEYYFINKK